MAAGLKPEGLDVGVLVSDAEDTVSAARFTTNARVGAPSWCRRQARTHDLRAVVANAAHSNVGDGRRGLETAVAMQAAAAEALGVEPDRVARGLHRGDRHRAAARAGAGRGPGGARAGSGSDADTFSEAIMTSDRAPKRACLEVALPAARSGSPARPRARG